MDKCPKYPAKSASYWEEPFNVFFCCCCEDLNIQPPGPTEQQIKNYGQKIDKSKGEITCKFVEQSMFLFFYANGKVADIYHLEDKNG